jgi:hypothetical protein
MRCKGWHYSNRVNRKMRRACMVDPEMRTARQTWYSEWHKARQDERCHERYGAPPPQGWAEARAYCRTVAAR